MSHIECHITATPVMDVAMTARSLFTCLIFRDVKASRGQTGLDSNIVASALSINIRPQSRRHEAADASHLLKLKSVILTRLSSCRYAVIFVPTPVSHLFYDYGGDFR